MNNNVNTPSKEDINQEDFYNYYVIEGHTQKECCEHFKINHHIVTALVKEWGLIDEVKARTKSGIIRSRKPWRPPLSLEVIQKEYLETALSGKEVAEKLGVSFSTFRRCIAFYGVHKDCELVQQNIYNVWDQKYEGGHPQRDAKIREKTKATCLQKYGTTNPSQNAKVIEKIKRAEKYEIPYTKKEIYEQYILCNKTIESCAEYFGVANHVFQRWLKRYNIIKSQDQVTKARENTCLSRYGDTNVMRCQDILERAKLTNLEKYGTENQAQAHILHVDTWLNDESFASYVKAQPEPPTILALCDYFNLTFSAVIRRIHRLKLEKFTRYKSSRSTYEDDIVNLLRGKFHISNIQLNVRNVLPSGREIDIYLPDYKLGIEFNGEYWHSEANEKYADHSGRSVYHQSKSLEAEQQGIFLFHIFEHEWNDLWISKNKKFANSRSNIINRLGNLLQTASHKIPARACVIKLVSKQETKEFLTENHIQGAGHAAQTYGLYYNDKLVSCMCFIGSKYKKYTYELSRFASAHDTVVQGGASKLFKYFVNNILKDGETIVSYNDITKTKGTLYQTLGFKCTSINDPNYWWVNFETCDIRSRYQEQEADEVNRMHSLGYYRICDCGTRTWVYTKQQ